MHTETHTDTHTHTLVYTPRLKGKISQGCGEGA